MEKKTLREKTLSEDAIILNQSISYNRSTFEFNLENQHEKILFNWLEKRSIDNYQVTVVNNVESQAEPIIINICNK